MAQIGPLLQRRGDVGRAAISTLPPLGADTEIKIGCWMEASVAVHTISNASEMNGFLKAKDHLFIHLPDAFAF